jgi:2-desacetyl-2-hydroxyethyl bacteriochlorophyllide A dehydrogenase
MRVKQAVLLGPYQTGVQDAELSRPASNQILVATAFSVISAGTELAVYTGTHQWLKDPKMVEWKFPFKPGYSAAGTIVEVGSAVKSWKAGDRVAYPGNHASGELLTLGQERGRLWKMPDHLDFATAAWSCVARYGMGAAIRVGITLGRSAVVLGLGVIGQFALRCLKAAGAYPVLGIDGVAMRRQAALQGGADHVLDPQHGDIAKHVQDYLHARGAEVVADATGVPDALPTAMSLACDAGQVVVVGSPRGKAHDVNFYDDLHRRYLEVTGAHGNMLFEPAHTRLAGAWDIDKAADWLLGAMANKRLTLEGLVTQTISPEALGQAYEGLLKNKDDYLGVVVKWS